MKTRLLLFSLFCLIVISCKYPQNLSLLPTEYGDNSLTDNGIAPFYHGVASGDPLHNSVILWTRVTSKTEAAIKVKWMISKEASMKSVLQSGTVTADVSKDFTVKVDVNKLESGTTYFYQFEATGKKSSIGRTKTTAATNGKQVKVAFVSCSNYEAGYYNAYSRIAEKKDIDAVVHLGDYIYEYAPGGYGDSTLNRKHLPAKEITTLSDYRIRYAQYRMDKDLQKVHQNHPFITIWDDHEVANNVFKEGAQNHQPEKEGNFQTRKEAAKQAYFEWLPIRDNVNKDIYRTISFGNLLDLILLDERLTGRTYPVDSIAQAEYKSENRTMLGSQQLTWFKNELKKSKATWKVIGNQVIFSSLDLRQRSLRNPVNLDAWDGYPYEQQQIRQFLGDNKISNVVFTTGDTHSSWAFEVPANLSDYKSNPTSSVVAIEFGTPSITSSNSDERMPVKEVIASEVGLLTGGFNPHLKYVDLKNHGYLLITFSPETALAEWYYVDKLNVPSKVETKAKQFVLRNGVYELK